MTWWQHLNSTVKVSRDFNPKLAANWAHRNFFVSASSCEPDSYRTWLLDKISWFEEMQYAWSRVVIYMFFPSTIRIWHSVVDQSLKIKFIKSVLLSEFLMNFSYSWTFSIVSCYFFLLHNFNAYSGICWSSLSFHWPNRLAELIICGKEGKSRRSIVNFP